MHQCAHPAAEAWRICIRMSVADLHSREQKDGVFALDLQKVCRAAALRLFSRRGVSPSARTRRTEFLAFTVDSCEGFLE